MPFRYYPSGNESINTDRFFRLLLDSTLTSFGEGLPIAENPEHDIKVAACMYLRLFRDCPSLCSDFNIFTTVGTYSLDLNYLPPSLLSGHPGQFDEWCDFLRASAVSQAIAFLMSNNITVLGYLSIVHGSMHLSGNTVRPHDVVMITYEHPIPGRNSKYKTRLLPAIARHQIVVPHEHGVIIQEDINRLFFGKDFNYEHAIVADYDLAHVFFPSIETDSFFTRWAPLALSYDSHTAATELKNTINSSSHLLDFDDVLEMNPRAMSFSRSYKSRRTVAKTSRVNIKR